MNPDESFNKLLDDLRNYRNKKASRLEEERLERHAGLAPDREYDEHPNEDENHG